MFVHGKTGKVYYSVREKIRYYDKRLKTDKTLSDTQREYAKRRLSELQQLNNRSFSEPTLIVTDDKHFGNGMSKPRLCVAFKPDTKGRIFVAPIHKTESKDVVLDKYPERQVSDNSRAHNRMLDISDVYETKYVTMDSEYLTDYDRKKIKNLFRK